MEDAGPFRTRSRCCEIRPCGYFSPQLASLYDSSVLFYLPTNRCGAHPPRYKDGRRVSDMVMPILTNFVCRCHPNGENYAPLTRPTGCLRHRRVLALIVCSSRILRLRELVRFLEMCLRFLLQPRRPTSSRLHRSTSTPGKKYLGRRACRKTFPGHRRHHRQIGCRRDGPLPPALSPLTGETRRAGSMPRDEKTMNVHGVNGNDRLDTGKPRANLKCGEFDRWRRVRVLTLEPTPPAAENHLQ